MGSSAKKKREKKQDFKKTQLKVGKARPKNTNATDTNFSTKSIVLKQQNLSETGRDVRELLEYNLSLLSSKSETQRRDAVMSLTAAVAASDGILFQPASVILSKAQPLIIDGSSSVRTNLLKLFKVLPRQDLGPFDQVLLYTRAGLMHLSTDIRMTSLDVLEWLLDINGPAVTGCAGGWVKTIRTFQNLLSWHGMESSKPSSVSAKSTWTASTASNGKLGNSKLIVRQLTALAHLLTVGLIPAQVEARAAEDRAAALFPLWSADAHLIPSKSDPFGYLNLFGAVRDVESEAYEDADERVEVFLRLGMRDAFDRGVRETKRAGGEVGRAAVLVDKALKLMDASS